MLTMRTPLQCGVHSSRALGSKRRSRLNVDRERYLQRNRSTDTPAPGEATAGLNGADLRIPRALAVGVRQKVQPHGHGHSSHGGQLEQL
jgi:hypothetical protein